MPEENKVQWVYASKDNAQLAERYDEWAKDYDQDLARDFEWHGPRLAVDAFAKHVPQSARVIDVGVGTGLAGVELAKRGFTNIDGFDLSQGMLDEAAKLGIYGDLRVGILGESLDFQTASYDAAISTGVFTVGHAPASGFDEVARIVKPGGVFVLTIRPDTYEGAGFKEKDEELTASGKWKLLDASEPAAFLPKGEPDVRHQVRTYQILK